MTTITLLNKFTTIFFQPMTIGEQFATPSRPQMAIELAQSMANVTLQSYPTNEENAYLWRFRCYNYVQADSLLQICANVTLQGQRCCFVHPISLHVATTDGVTVLTATLKEALLRCIDLAFCKGVVMFGDDNDELLIVDNAVARQLLSMQTMSVQSCLLRFFEPLVVRLVHGADSTTLVTEAAALRELPQLLRCMQSDSLASAVTPIDGVTSTYRCASSTIRDRLLGLGAFHVACVSCRFVIAPSLFNDKRTTSIDVAAATTLTASAAPAAAPPRTSSPIEFRLIHDAENCFVPHSLASGSALFDVVRDELCNWAHCDKQSVELRWQFVMPSSWTRGGGGGKSDFQPSRRVLKELGDRGVTQITVDNEKSGAVDRKVKALIGEFARDQRALSSAAARERRVLVLLSGDSDFCDDVRAVLLDGGSRVLLLHNGVARRSMIDIVGTDCSLTPWPVLVEHARHLHSTLGSDDSSGSGESSKSLEHDNDNENNNNSSSSIKNNNNKLLWRSKKKNDIKKQQHGANSNGNEDGVKSSVVVKIGDDFGRVEFVKHCFMARLQRLVANVVGCSVTFDTRHAAVRIVGGKKPSDWLAAKTLVDNALQSITELKLELHGMSFSSYVNNRSLFNMARNTSIFVVPPQGEILTVECATELDDSMLLAQLRRQWDVHAYQIERRVSSGATSIVTLVLDRTMHDATQHAALVARIKAQQQQAPVLPPVSLFERCSIARTWRLVYANDGGSNARHPQQQQLSALQAALEQQQRERRIVTLAAPGKQLLAARFVFQRRSARRNAAACGVQVSDVCLRTTTASLEMVLCGHPTAIDRVSAALRDELARVHVEQRSFAAGALVDSLVELIEQRLHRFRHDIKNNNDDDDGDDCETDGALIQYPRKGLASVVGVAVMNEHAGCVRQLFVELDELVKQFSTEHVEMPKSTTVTKLKLRSRLNSVRGPVTTKHFDSL